MIISRALSRAAGLLSTLSGLACGEQSEVDENRRSGQRANWDWRICQEATLRSQPGARSERQLNDSEHDRAEGDLVVQVSPLIFQEDPIISLGVGYSAMHPSATQNTGQRHTVPSLSPAAPNTNASSFNELEAILSAPWPSSPTRFSGTCHHWIEHIAPLPKSQLLIFWLWI